MKKAVIYCWLMLMITPCGAALLGQDAFDTINISADEAFEDEQPGILHLNGHFLMQSRDWQLTSATATVYGNPSKPDRIYLEGSPARFIVHPTDNTAQYPVEAVAPVVEYLRLSNKLMLSGGAVLTLGDEVIRSATIEYDIGTNRYHAGGTDGVLIEVLPSASPVSPLIRD